MAWYAPPLPRADHDSKVAYWRSLLDIPDDEPAAGVLRSIAAQRLVSLGAMDPDQAGIYLENGWSEGL